MGRVEQWSTDQVPEASRFDAWSDKLRSLHLDWDLAASKDRACFAEIRYRRLGDISIADFRGSGFRGSRDPTLDTADVVGIQLTLAGRQPCGYADDEFTLADQDLFVWGSGMGRAFDSSDGHHEITVLVPRGRVPRPLDSWLGQSRALATGPGAGLVSIAADQLRSINRELENLSSQALSVMVDQLLDTVGAVVAPAEDSASSERVAMLARVRDYIDNHLDDPRMSATTIAAAQGISVRTLHLVFAGSGSSLSRWIRHRRLERCRRDLSRAGAGTTVTEIAFRWGFSDAAHFSRVFKQEFGTTPSSTLLRPDR